MQKESPTLVAEEIASISGGEVPSSRRIKVLGFPTGAHQLGQVLVVWVVVKRTNVLAAADHVIHIRGVVDGRDIGQRPDSYRLRWSCACPLVSLDTGRLEDKRLVSKSSPSRTGGCALGARGNVRLVRIEISLACPGGIPHPRPPLLNPFQSFARASWGP